MRFTYLLLALCLAGCANQNRVFIEKHLDTGAQPPQAPALDQTAQRGQYLVGLLGCSSCHTDGALMGQANSRYLLAGSNTGIATSNPLREPNPGMVFPPNLTPDKETGLGLWSETDIALMIKSGEDRHGIRQSAVMPWAAYAQLTDVDALAIAHYLKSLPPVKHQVPKAVRKGQPSDLPHVYFGVYQKP